MLRAVRLDEALGELGLSEITDASEVRKAYLRLLKTRKPEVDPEGFMRLREAFELVNTMLRVGVFQALRSREAETAKDKEAPPLQVNTEQPSTPSEGSASEPVVALNPGPDPAPSADTQAEDGPPEPVHEQEAASGPSWSLTLDKPKEAAATLCSMLAYAKDGREVPPQLPFLTIDVLLRLHLTGSLKTARSLLEAFEEWLLVTASETRFSPVMAIRWAMLRELWAVRHELPLEVRAPIARGIASGDFKATRVELARFRRQEPDTAERAALALRVHAQVLSPRVVSALDSVRSEPDAGPSPAPQRARAGASPWWMIFIAVQVLLGIGRCASQSSSAGYGSSPPRSPAFAPIRDKQGTLTDYSQDVLAVVYEADGMGRADIATLAHGVGEALLANKCEDAKFDMEELRIKQKSAPQDSYPTFAESLRVLEDDVRRRCPDGFQTLPQEKP